MPPPRAPAQPFSPCSLVVHPSSPPPILPADARHQLLMPSGPPPHAPPLPATPSPDAPSARLSPPPALPVLAPSDAASSLIPAAAAAAGSQRLLIILIAVALLATCLCLVLCACKRCVDESKEAEARRFLAAGDEAKQLANGNATGGTLAGANDMPTASLASDSSAATVESAQEGGLGSSYATSSNTQASAPRPSARRLNAHRGATWRAPGLQHARLDEESHGPSGDAVLINHNPGGQQFVSMNI